MNNKKFNFVLTSSVSLKELMEDPMVDKNFFADSFANSFFPVLEGTPYGKNDYTIPENWFELYKKLRGKIIKYEENCEYMLNRKLTKDMFHDHSLFLLKESLKTFSPYSEKAKELLIKLESLE